MIARQIPADTLASVTTAVLINVYITTSLTNAPMAFDAKNAFDPSKHLAILEDALPEKSTSLHYSTIESGNGDSSSEAYETERMTSEPLVSMAHLFPRADAVDSRVRVKVVNESRCFWNSNIQETQTRPLW